MGLGYIEFDVDKCKGCGLCVIYCPVQIIGIKNDQLNQKGYSPAGVTDMEKCTSCTQCALMCPDNVITVYRYKKNGEKK